MEDKKLIYLVGKEIEKHKIIYDKNFNDFPRYGNKFQLKKIVFAEIANSVREKNDYYFWLKG